MPLRLYNTLTNSQEAFDARDLALAAREGRRPRVTFYTCGPTVYDYAHIGNFRSFLAADTLRRWLESPLCERPDGTLGGYDVRQVMNITDVGHMVDDSGAGGDAADGEGADRMQVAQQRLLEQKKSGKLPAGAGAEFDPANPFHIAEFYAQAFIEDGTALGLRIMDDAKRHPELMPRPTRYVPQMLGMIETLLANGHAYIGSDGVAYFDTQSFPDYGRLSGNTLDRIRSGAGGRVSEQAQSVKKHPADFMLWKPDARHLMRWDPAKELGHATPLREGYPGWHVECSAMAAALLGDEIDLHSGGEDNIFPHHECEIAQSRCAHGTPTFARTWFHPRFLMVEGEKMSKSKGNFYTVRDLTSKGFDPGAVRLELIKTHYRSNANFTEQGLRDSARMVERWKKLLERARASAQAGARDEEAVRAFSQAMNDDLNVAGAIAALSSWTNRVQEPTRADAELLELFDGVLGVLNLKAAEHASPPAGGDEARINELVAARTTARASKNWPEADRIRKELDALGVVVTDSPAGPTWSRQARL